MHERIPAWYLQLSQHGLVDSETQATQFPIKKFVQFVPKSKATHLGLQVNACLCSLISLAFSYKSPFYVLVGYGWRLPLYLEDADIYQFFLLMAWGWKQMGFWGNCFCIWLWHASRQQQQHKSRLLTLYISSSISTWNCWSYTLASPYGIRDVSVALDLSTQLTG